MNPTEHSHRRKYMIWTLYALIALVAAGGIASLVHTLRYDPTVYIRSVEVTDSLKARGISPEMIARQAVQTQQMLVTTALAPFKCFLGGVTDTITMTPASIACREPGNYGLMPSRADRLRRAVRRLFGRPSPELSLTFSGGDSLTVEYRITSGDRTLASAQRSFHTSDISWSMDSTALVQLTPERRTEMMVSIALIPVCNAVGELNNPLVGRFQPHVENFTRGQGLDFDFLTGATGAYHYEWLQSAADSLDRYFKACGVRHRLWGNFALGRLCDCFGLSIDDTTVIRRAQAYYRKAGAYDRHIGRALDYRIQWLDAYIADCARTNSDNAFVSTFLNDSIALPDSCRQLILVYNEQPEQVLCAMRRYERKAGGLWREVGTMIHANVGRTGIAPWNEKREGDGHTPTGAFAMGTAFGYAKDIQLRWPFLVVTPHHYWISDPADPHYNELTTVKPTTDDFEYLRRDDDAYKYAAVVEYNMHPVTKGYGSAIFFHLESGFNCGSAGCITTSEPRVIETLQWLDPTCRPYMLIRTNPTHRHSARIDSQK